MFTIVYSKIMIVCVLCRSQLEAKISIKLIMKIFVKNLFVQTVLEKKKRKKSDTSKIQCSERQETFMTSGVISSQAAVLHVAMYCSAAKTCKDFSLEKTISISVMKTFKS